MQHILSYWRGQQQSEQSKGMGKTSKQHAIQASAVQTGKRMDAIASTSEHSKCVA